MQNTDSNSIEGEIQIRIQQITQCKFRWRRSTNSDSIDDLVQISMKTHYKFRWRRDTHTDEGEVQIQRNRNTNPVEDVFIINIHQKVNKNKNKD